MYSFRSRYTRDKLVSFHEFLSCYYINYMVEHAADHHRVSYIQKHIQCVNGCCCIQSTLINWTRSIYCYLVVFQKILYCSFSRICGNTLIILTKNNLKVSIAQKLYIYTLLFGLRLTTDDIYNVSCQN